MLELPSRDSLINAGEQCCTGISLRCFSKYVDVAPSDHSTTGITVAFVFNSYCISFLKFRNVKFFSSFLSFTFQSRGNTTSIIVVVRFVLLTTSISFHRSDI